MIGVRVASGSDVTYTSFVSTHMFHANNTAGAVFFKPPLLYNRNVAACRPISRPRLVCGYMHVCCKGLYGALKTLNLFEFYFQNSRPGECLDFLN